MKKFLLPLLVALLLPLSLMASTFLWRGSVKGRVLDAETGAPLPGVNIMVAHTTIGAASGLDGAFNLPRVPLGEIELIATMMGYKKDVIHLNVDIEPSEEVEIRLNSTVLQLSGVVVTGTGTPHLVEDTPVRTQLIPRLAIRQKQAPNLAEALAFQTGVRVENNCGNCNFTQVRLLGMEGNYAQILIDGDPVINSLSGVYGLEHIPEEMVDQIEIVKGGASSLYGAGAVAGVVNVITRRPMQNQMRTRSTLHSTDGELDHHLGLVAERVNADGTSGAYIHGSMRSRNPVDVNGDDFSELGEIAHESIGFKWFYKPLETGEFSASFHRIHETRRGGNKFDQPVHEAEIAEALEHWRTGATLRWEHRPSVLFDYKLYAAYSYEHRKSYYGGLGGNTDQDRLEALKFYGNTKNPLLVTGIQGNYRAGSHLITSGVQHSSDKLTDESAANPVYNIDNTYTNTGIFLQDNLHFGTDEQLELVFGARADKHSELDDWVFSPRVNLKAKLGRGMIFRSSASTGFKAPQTFDEDLHIESLGGDQRIIRNAEGLKHERSLSLTAGLEWTGSLGDMPVQSSVSFFRIRIEDSFMDSFVSADGDVQLWEHINSDGAEVKGLEMDLAMRPIGDVELRGGFMYKKSEYDSPSEDFGTTNFMRTPDFSGNLNLNMPFSHHFKMSLNAKYLGEMDVPHEIVVDGQDEPLLELTQSKSFIQLDLGFAVDLHLSGHMEPIFNFGVKNVLDAYQDDLDVGANRDPAYVYGPMRPRTYYCGLELTF